MTRAPNLPSTIFLAVGLMLIGINYPLLVGFICIVIGLATSQAD